MFIMKQWKTLVITPSFYYLQYYLQSKSRNQNVKADETSWKCSYSAVK